MLPFGAGPLAGLQKPVDRFWARLTEICTFLSSTCRCHGGRGLPDSVFNLGLFLKNNGPVWHPWAATGLQFLAGNGPFLALSQTRPAAAPHLQNPNGPPGAEKAPKRANHQPIWPPVHGKASWGLATPNAGHLVWPLNLACWALCTFHSSFPPFAPPCGPGTPCPGTKMAKPAKMLRHHIVGGQPGCGLGLWITTWQV